MTMNTRIYICNIEPQNGKAFDMAQLSALAARLSAERQEKIQARRFEKDRLQVLGAGLLLDYGLRDYGLRECDAAIAYKGNGKPYLADYPRIHFNLSHSGSMVMAVFSDREIGCDIERRQEARMSVARRFFTEEETAQLEAQAPGEERNRLFFRLWTLKESYLKVTGEGMRMPLDSFAISLEDRYPSVRAGLEVLDYTFREFTVPGYQAAVCLKGRFDGNPSEWDGEVFFSFQNLQDVV